MSDEEQLLNSQLILFSMDQEKQNRFKEIWYEVIRKMKEVFNFH